MLAPKTWLSPTVLKGANGTDTDHLKGAKTAAAVGLGTSVYEAYMQVALAEAELAAAEGEVPVGAVVVYNGQIIARAHNRRETERDPLAHAEIMAIRAAARYLCRWRLSGCTLVTTLEPCPMCAGAIVNARLDTLVYGARDPRAGAVGSLMDVVQDPRLNHRACVVADVCGAQAGELLSSFFAARRAQRRSGLSSPVA